MGDALLTWLNVATSQHRWLEDAASVASHRAFGMGLAVLAAAAVAERYRPWWVVVAAVAGAVGMCDAVGAHVIKPLLADPRPCQVRVDLYLPLGCGSDFGMPSLHAANSFALVGVVAVLHRRYVAVVLPLAAAVAISRLCLGLHDLGDVVAGAAYGLVVGTAAALVALRFLDDRAAARVRVGRIDRRPRGGAVP